MSTINIKETFKAYFGRWISTKDKTTEEFHIVNVDPNASQAITENGERIDLIELDFNTEKYTKLENPFTAPEIGNQLKAYANRSEKPANDLIEDQPIDKIKSILGDINSPHTPIGPIITDNINKVKTSITVDEETQLIQSAIRLSKNKGEFCKIKAEININVDFDLLRIVELSDQLGVDPEKALRIMLDEVNIPKSAIIGALTKKILES